MDNLPLGNIIRKNAASAWVALVAALAMLCMGAMVFGYAPFAYGAEAVAMRTLSYDPVNDDDYQDTYLEADIVDSASEASSNASDSDPAYLAAAFLAATFEACESKATMANAGELGITPSSFDEGYQIAMDDPRFFYVDMVIGYGFTDDGKALVVKPRYLWSTKAEIEDAKQRFYDAVAQALDWVDQETMSELELAQALHDYLVRTCIYDKDCLQGDDRWIAHTAYGALVDKSTVCQGYSMAYKLLCSQVGVNCLFVTSSYNNHGWNMVQMDDNWYHVDITFDDPVTYSGGYADYCDGGFEGEVSHAFFLVSDLFIYLAGGHFPWERSKRAPYSYELDTYPVYDGPVSKGYSSNPSTGIVATVCEKSIVYTGSEIAPAITLAESFANGAKEQIDSSAFSVRYVNNVNAGTGFAIITSQQYLTGPLIAKFTIGKASASTVSATLKTKSYTYSGNAKKPAFKNVKVNGKVLSSDQYSVTYKSNKKVGLGSAVLSFNNYSATITKHFKINPKAVTLKSVSAGSGSFKATWKKSSKSGAVTGYQVRYSTQKSMSGHRMKKVSKKLASKTIRSLASGKRYYVQVRAYTVVNGKTYYSSWSKRKSTRVS